MDTLYTEYAVITEEDLGALTRLVNHKLQLTNSGWQCEGGISMCVTDGDKTTYAQAMTRKRLKVCDKGLALR